MKQADTLDLLIQSYESGQPISSYFDSERIADLVNSDSDDIRLWLAKSLINTSTHPAVPLLCKLMQDSNPLVRVEAADSLSAFICPESFSAFVLAASDSYELVRSYAAFGVAVVGRDIAKEKAISVLASMQSCEYNSRVLVDIYGGMYLLGQEEKLQDMLALFQLKDHRIQCAILHLLEEIIDEENSVQISQFIDGLDISEYAFSVADAISKLKDSLISIQGNGEHKETARNR